MKNTNKKILFKQLTTYISFFFIVVSIANATLIERGTLDWDIPFENIWNVSHINGTFIDNSSLIRVDNLSTILVDGRIVNDLTIQTTKDLTIGGGFASGGITLTATGTGNFQDILLAGNLTLVNEGAVNGSMNPVIGITGGLGNASNQWSWLNVSGNAYVGSLTSIGDISIIGGVNISGGLNVTAGDVLLVTTSGNVGIGTTNPSYKLTVVGNANISGARFISNSFINFTNNTVFNETLYVINGNVGIGTIKAGVKLVVQGVFNATAQTNGQADLFVASTGRVGIGVPNPEGKLDILNGSGAGTLLISLQTSGVRTQYINQTPTGTLIFTTNLDHKPNFVIDDGGNVGIGTESPTQKLEISDSLTGTLRLLIINTLTGAGSQHASLDIRSENTDYLRFLDSGGSVSGSIFGGTDYGGALGFSSNGATERMRLTANGGLSLGNSYTGTDPGAGSMIISGNFGIGTTSPGRALEVSGSINGTQLNISGPTNLAYGSGNVGIGTTSPIEKLVISGNMSVHNISIRTPSGVGGLIFHNGSGICIVSC